jgi:hypothetical protein
MLPDGRFAPRNQILERPKKLIQPGSYRIKASAPYLDLKKSIEFTASFDRSGGEIRFLDTSGGIIAISEIFLSEEMGYRTQLALEVYDWGSNPSAAEIAVRLSSYDENGREFEFTTVGLKRQKKPGVYSNVGASVRIFPYPGKFRSIVDGVFEGNFFRKNLLRTPNEGVAEIRAEVQLSDGKAQASVPVYKSEVFAAWDLVRRLLESQQEAIVELRAAAVNITAEQNRILNEKERMIQRALQILKEPRLAPNDMPRGQFIVAHQYLEFLKINDLLKPKKGTVMFDITLLGGTQLPMPYFSQAEQMALERAGKIYKNTQQRGLEPVADELIASLQNAPAEIFELAKVSLTQIAGAPVFSGYLLVYGLTMEGEQAEAVDYVLAGIDMASFVIQSPPRAHVNKRLAKKRKKVSTKRRKRQRIEKKHKKPRPRIIQGEKLPDGFQEVVPYDLLRFAEPDIDWLFKKWDEVDMPIELQRRQLTALTRIWDSKLIVLLKKKIEEDQRGLRWAMGLMEHWVNQLKNRAYLDYLVSTGQADFIETGRYRFLDGKEELVEWTIPGTKKRIDHGLIDPEAKIIQINDIAAGPSKSHWAKGQLYVEMLEELFPGYKVKYCEYEWSEMSGKLLKSRTFSL